MSEKNRDLKVLFRELLRSNPTKQELVDVLTDIPELEREAADALLTRTDLVDAEYTVLFEKARSQDVRMLILRTIESKGLDNRIRRLVLNSIEDEEVQRRYSRELLEHHEGVVDLEIALEKSPEEDVRLEAAQLLLQDERTSAGLEVVVTHFHRDESMLFQVVEHPNANQAVRKRVLDHAGYGSELYRRTIELLLLDPGFYGLEEWFKHRITGIKDEDLLQLAAAKLLAKGRVEELRQVNRQVEETHRERFWLKLLKPGLEKKSLDFIWCEVESLRGMARVGKAMLRLNENRSEEYERLDDALSLAVPNFWNPELKRKKPDEYLLRFLAGRSVNPALRPIAARLLLEKFSSFDNRLLVYAQVPELKGEVEKLLRESIPALEEKELHALLRHDAFAPEAWEQYVANGPRGYELVSVIQYHPNYRLPAWQLLKKIDPGRHHLEECLKYPEIAEEAQQVLDDLPNNFELIESMRRLSGRRRH